MNNEIYLCLLFGTILHNLVNGPEGHKAIERIEDMEIDVTTSEIQHTAYAKIKAQISCAATAQLISAFVMLHGQYHASATYIQSFKHLAFFCDNTDRFVSDLVGNPNCWFSHAI